MVEPIQKHRHEAIDLTCFGCQRVPDNAPLPERGCD